MTTTLYRVYDERDWLLYVGISDAPLLRFAQHADAAASWGRYARKVTFEPYPTREQAEMAELEAIRTEDPVWNMRGRDTMRFYRWMLAYPSRHADDIDVDEMRSVISRAF